MPVIEMACVSRAHRCSNERTDAQENQRHRFPTGVAYVQT